MDTNACLQTGKWYSYWLMRSYTNKPMSHTQAYTLSNHITWMYINYEYVFLINEYSPPPLFTLFLHMSLTWGIDFNNPSRYQNLIMIDYVLRCYKSILVQGQLPRKRFYYMKTKAPSISSIPTYKINTDSYNSIISVREEMVWTLSFLQGKLQVSWINRYENFTPLPKCC